jgi:8-oxo-dGTP pyrophosphatase MutT (NUDIX family)
LNQVFQALKLSLDARTRRVLSARRRAAVLMPIIVEDTQLSLLLTRRTETLSSHRGQVAFPGGGADDADPTLVHTALREAHEEVGLNSSAVDIVGLLDDVPTVTEETIVTPVIGYVQSMPELSANPSEVARIFTVPFDYLKVDSNWRVEERTHGGKTYPIYFLEYDGEILWGLSAHFTRQLLNCMNYLPA